MKAQIASTNQIVDIKAVGHDGMTKARVWEGETEGGVRFTAYIPLVQVHKGDNNSQFERLQLLEALKGLIEASGGMAPVGAESKYEMAMERAEAAIAKVRI